MPLKNILSKQRFSKKNTLKCIIFGELNKNTEKFLGKIKNFSVFKKNLKEKEISSLISLNLEYSLFNMPYNYPLNDIKTLQDLREFILFDSNVSVSWTNSATNSLNKHIYIKETHILDTIFFYNPTNLLVTLIENSKTVLLLNTIYEIFSRIISYSKTYDILNKQFICHICYLLNKNLIDVSTTKKY